MHEQPDDDADYDEEDGTPFPREKSMGFFDHLEELRWTLVKSAIVFGVFAALIGVSIRRFNDVLLWPLRDALSGREGETLELGTRTVLEGFTVMLQICGVGGMVMAGPFILYFAGQFVAPALSQRELRLLLPTALTAFLLFCIGAAFSFFLLVPSTIEVSLKVNEMFGFTELWTPAAYYNLLLWLVLGVGVAFEFPLVIVLLVWLGMLTTARLIRWWRHALLGAFIVSAIVTPTPDPITQTALALPLYGLYWLAILVAGRVEKRRSTDADRP